MWLFKLLCTLSITIIGCEELMPVGSALYSERQRVSLLPHIARSTSDQQDETLTWSWDASLRSEFSLCLFLIESSWRRSTRLRPGAHSAEAKSAAQKAGLHFRSDSSSRRANGVLSGRSAVAEGELQRDKWGDICRTWIWLLKRRSTCWLELF